MMAGRMVPMQTVTDNGDESPNLFLIESNVQAEVIAHPGVLADCEVVVVPYTHEGPRMVIVPEPRCRDRVDHHGELLTIHPDLADPDARVVSGLPADGFRTAPGQHPPTRLFGPI